MTSTAFATPEEAEQAFYDALASGDAMRLMQVWADDEDIACIHPGGVRTHGHHDVRESWREILAAGPLVIRPSRVVVLPSISTVVHIVVEQISLETPAGPQPALCYATNVYHKGRMGWHMVLHHASQAPDQAAMMDLHEMPDLLH